MSWPSKLALCLVDCIRTDGSFNMRIETASFGWLLTGNENVLVQGAGPVDSVPSVLSSTRAELFGVAAPNELLFHFMKFFKIESMSKSVKSVGILQVRIA